MKKQYDCPEYVEALLNQIRYELDRIMWNKYQKEYSSPFSNTGNKFKNKTFRVEAYSWGEDTKQKYNFKWKNIEIRWYKYNGNGMSINCKITPYKAVTMMNDCLRSLRKMEKDI